VGDTYAGEGVAADRLGTITRDDCSSQVTFNGRPLYRYSQDEKLGDAKGQNQGGVWFVVSTYGGPVQSNAAVSAASNPVLGAILVDAGGRTLYGFASDEENVSRCTGGCALTSPPLLTLGGPSGGASMAHGRLGTVSRDDGSTQVVYNGRPLYYYSQDDKPGDAKGHNRDGVWSVVSSEAALAVSLTLAPSKDATLYEDPVGAFANGAGEYLFTGNINRGSSRRALIAFNLVGSIPPGATIKSVSLTLNMSRTVAGAGLVELRRVLADWGEGASDPSANEGGGTLAESGDATWIHRSYDTARWQSPGGDFSSEASASATVVGPGTYTWDPTPELVADVQAWLDDPSANFGWLLLGNESGNQTTKRFDSRENLEVKDRPKLTIGFTSGAGEGPKPGSPAEKGAY
jgi:predicted lipoprotein with Yx(FWY)xxD motif